MFLESLYFNYGKEVVLKWITNLHIFRLCVPHPYPDDFKPIRYQALIKFNSEKELTSILEQLNFEAFKGIIPEAKYQDLNENNSAGWIKLLDVVGYLNVNKILKNITLEISGKMDDMFQIDESTFIAAKKIDEFLQTLNLLTVEPPQNDEYCICPKYYPEIWKKK